MQLIDGKEAAWLEPKLSCIAALHLPQSGVISVKHYVTALVGDLEAAGGEVLRSCVFQSAKASPNMVDIDIQGASQTKISCAYLVNAAGLQAHAVAGKIDGLDPILIPRIYYAKGNYFRILAPAPFERLIYPIPIPGGSGLHYGWDGAGQARLGPDVEWIDAPDYTVHPKRLATFEASARAYWPSMPENCLEPDIAGVVPKLGKTGPRENDFLIQDFRVHGLKSLVNLFGIESPGLTASMAIAERLRETSIT
jgi:L-2-hydroxyglutarate oxidase LhgO